MKKCDIRSLTLPNVNVLLSNRLYRLFSDFRPVVNFNCVSSSKFVLTQLTQTRTKYHSRQCCV